MPTIVLDKPDFLILNKPTGMPMHDSEEAITLRAQSLFSYEKLWLVHRLDTDTSGCIILAKNKLAASELSKQFAAQTVQKYYIALIDLKPKKKQGMIKGDMKKARNGDWKLTTSQDNPAITHFFSFALKQNSLMTSSIASKSKREGQQAHLLGPALRLCVVKPTSGKTHQIRVALKSLGTPIVGDKRYKGSQADRLYLHSYAIQFKYNEEFIQASCLPESGSLFSNISSHLAEIPNPWLMQWPTNKH